MMMDVRELVTKFSFQVNSEAVKDFIGLLAKAETSLDELGKKTTVNAGKARVEGEKRTQRQIDAIQSKWDKRRSDRLKIATKEQQKADKQQLDYEEKRSKVLSARDLSRIKRRIKAEETANKLIAKQQIEANKALIKQEKEVAKIKIANEKQISLAEKQRQSDKLRQVALSQRQNKELQQVYRGIFNAGKNSPIEDLQRNLRLKSLKSANDNHAKMLSEEARLQQWLQRGSLGEKARMAGMFSSVKINRTGSEDLVGFAKKTRLSLKQQSNILRRASQEESKGFQELLFFKGFSNKYDNKETSNPVIPAGTTSIPQKSLNDFVDNLFGSITEAMKKQNVVEKSVKKRTNAEIKDIQKRWDDRRRKRYTEEQQYEQWLQRGSIGEKARMAGMFSSVKINRTGSEDLVSHTRKVRLELLKKQALDAKEEARLQQWLQRGSIGEKARMAGMFSSVKTNRTGSEDLVSHTRKVRLELLKKQALDAKKAEKEALDYATRRSKVLQRHSVSRLKRRIRNANQPTPTGGGGGGFSLADTYFNLQLLKDAYQLFYNIAEATRKTAVNILRTNDALSMSIAKIGVITGDTKNASKNFEKLLDISAQTGSEIGVIEEIFNRLSIGKEGLGATTDQIIDFTSAIAKMSAFSEGGAAQQGALRQLGQMFGGAYIQAQEWNSIVDGLPMVASKIAKAMGTTREAMTFKIRQQTKDSPAYLINDIFPALLKILPEIEAEFNKLPPTLDRTLNKAGVGVLKFSLNLKKYVKMPELDAFYSRLDGTIQKIFKWADANKALIGTNINKFFGTLNGVLGSVDTQLKDTKGTAETINNAFYILDFTTKGLKVTFDAFLWTLNAIAETIKWISKNSAILYYLRGVEDFKVQKAFKQSLNTNPSLNSSLVGKVMPLGGMLNKNPQSSFGTKGGGVTVVQNNTFNGNSATRAEKDQTARMLKPATVNAVGTAIKKRSVGN